MQEKWQHHSSYKTDDKINHYALLGIKKTANNEDIKNAFNKHAKVWHPDEAPKWFERDELIYAQEIFKRVKEAYEVLSDTDMRENYDKNQSNKFPKPNSTNENTLIAHWKKLKEKLKKSDSKSYLDLFPQQKSVVESNVLTNVGQDEVIDHNGDLTINGDVGENACINIKDGSLIILGEVKKSARIIISISEEIKEPLPTTQPPLGRFIKANITTNENVLFGNVNIDYRIYTDDLVTMLGGNKCKITPASESPYKNKNTSNLDYFFAALGRNNIKKIESVNGFATAEIDGVKYQGKESIYIDGTSIYVDEVLQNRCSKESRTNTPPKAYKLLIHGNVGHKVLIDSNAPIEVKGNIGSSCQILSPHGGLLANNIGKYTYISVSNQISVSDVEKHCILKSTHQGLNAKNIKNNVNINVRDTVEVYKDIGNGCIVFSKNGLAARNIGKKVTIDVSAIIQVHNIGSHSMLTSLNNITVDSIGDSSTLISRKGQIKISGHSGDKVTLKAKGSVRAKDIGIKSTVKSSRAEVSLVNVGEQSTITARKDIDIDGSCPANVAIKSHHGTVRRKSSNNVTDMRSQDSYSTGGHEKELPCANALSNAQLLKKQGAFSIPSKSQGEKKEEDPIKVRKASSNNRNFP